jgi:hypothetical protein
MKLVITRENLWVSAINDKPGGLNGKLDLLAQAGADLQFVLARRAPDKPGKGVVFLAPLKGPKQLSAARKAGFHKSRSIAALRVEGANKAGAGAEITGALAGAGINLRGLSTVVLGRKFVLYLAFDQSADATKARRALGRL